MNYFISDLHFFCKSQTNEGSVNYDNRPFATVDEMHSVMLQRWNAKITNGDTVYILGDVALRGRNEALIALVAQLKGKKVLVRGNHDDLSDYRYKQLFCEVVDYKEISETIGNKTYKLVLCHYPILLWRDQHKGAILLYGHAHNSAEERFFQWCLTAMNEDETLRFRRNGCTKVRAFNVGACMDYMDYEPRTLQEILAIVGNDGKKIEMREYHAQVDMMANLRQGCALGASDSFNAGYPVAAYRTVEEALANLKERHTLITHIGLPWYAIKEYAVVETAYKDGEAVGRKILAVTPIRDGFEGLDKEIYAHWDEHNPLPWVMDVDGWFWQCPICGKYTREDEYTGKPVFSPHCPECGQPLRRPTPEELQAAENKREERRHRRQNG